MKKEGREGGREGEREREKKERGRVFTKSEWKSGAVPFYFF